MKKRNHMVMSFVLALWIFFYVFEENIFLTFYISFIVAVLSFLPDLDMVIEHKLTSFNRWTLFLFFPVVWLLKLFFRHRTITHSIWLPLVLFVLAEYFFVNELFVMIFRVVYVAVLLHIFEDSLTKSGVRIFYPLGLKLRLGNFNTGSKIDSFLIHVLSLFLLVFFIGFGLYF